VKSVQPGEKVFTKGFPAKKGKGKAPESNRFPVARRREDGFANAHELIRIVRRERDAFQEAGFSPDQNVAAQIRIVELDAPSDSFASAEDLSRA